jgi:hypothetical protein
MGYEVAEQLGWRMPQGIIYPTGGGGGLIGMWKAFEEMQALGWIGSERPPSTPPAHKFLQLRASDSHYPAPKPWG